MSEDNKKGACEEKKKKMKEEMKEVMKGVIKEEMKEVMKRRKVNYTSKESVPIGILCGRGVERGTEEVKWSR